MMPERKIIEQWEKGSRECPECGLWGWSQGVATASISSTSFYDKDYRRCYNNHYWYYEAYVEYDKPLYMIVYDPIPQGL